MIKFLNVKNLSIKKTKYINKLNNLKTYMLLNNNETPIRKIYAIFIAIGFSLLLAFLPIKLDGGDAIAGYKIMFSYLFTDPTTIIPFMKIFIPYGLLALGVAIAFKAGILNIGATGQFLTGAILVLVFAFEEKNLNPEVAIPTMIVLAFIGGGLAAILVALLKILFRINEVVSTLLLNWVFFYIARFIFNDSKIYNDSDSSSLERMFSFTLNGSIPNYVIPLIIFLSLIIITWIVFNFTTIGFQIKACGKNRQASKANGINVNLIFVLTFAISGALCGLAGAFYYIYYQILYTGVTDSFGPNSTLPIQGFNAIAISLFGFNEPFGIIFTSFFYSMMEYGTRLTQISVGITSNASNLILSFIIFFSALVVIFLNFKPFKHFVEYFISLQGKKCKDLKDEINKMKNDFNNNKNIQEISKKIKIINKQLNGLRIDWNQFNNSTFKLVKLNYQTKLNQIHNNVLISYTNLNQLSKTKSWMSTSLKTLDIENNKKVWVLNEHPLVKKRKKLIKIIESYTIELERKEVELTLARKKYIKTWYKNLKLPFLFLMELIP